MTLRQLLAPLRALLVNWLAMDATPPADRAEVAKAIPQGGSVRVTPGPIMRHAESIAKQERRAVTAADVIWARGWRRCTLLPNRPEYDESAAWVLMSMTGNGIARPTVEVEA